MYLYHSSMMSEIVHTMPQTSSHVRSRPPPEWNSMVAWPRSGECSLPLVSIVRYEMKSVYMMWIARRTTPLTCGMR